MDEPLRYVATWIGEPIIRSKWNGGKLGPCELKYDYQQEMWDYASDVEDDADDREYSVSSALSSEADSDSDIDDFAPEDTLQCVYNCADDVDARRYCFRKRKHNNVSVAAIDLL